MAEVGVWGEYAKLERRGNILLAANHGPVNVVRTEKWKMKFRRHTFKPSSEFPCLLSPGLFFIVFSGGQERGGQRRRWWRSSNRHRFMQSLSVSLRMNKFASLRRLSTSTSNRTLQSTRPRTRPGPPDLRVLPTSLASRHGPPLEQQRRSYTTKPPGGGSGTGGFPSFSFRPQHQKGEALKEYVCFHSIQFFWVKFWFASEYRSNRACSARRRDEGMCSEFSTRGTITTAL